MNPTEKPSLTIPSAPEYILDNFEQVGAAQLTNDIAVAWAISPAGASAGWWNQRLGVLRGFAAWLHTLDPDTEVPPTGILTGRFRRAVPYLYSDAEITAMMTAARSLPLPLQRHTYETLIGLLAEKRCASERPSGSTATMCVSAPASCR